MLIDSSSGALLLTAMVVGVTHTLLGPDHYLPFVALAKARKWSARKTLLLTGICGLGHVLGSIALGAIGVLAGWSLGSLEWIESARGTIAAWLLTGMGAIYLAWAIKGLGRKKEHSHTHVHADGTIHRHPHTHKGEHAHPHLANQRHTVTAWSLFVIFIFGPCEAFIPILFFPAVQHDWWLAGMTTLLFAASTIGTMMGVVYLMQRGMEWIPFRRFSRYGHVMAGLIILLCGTAIHLGF
ncbi:MAG: hypothetical protein AB3N64_09295 [Puniceicoccaceae bacterium]